MKRKKEIIREILKEFSRIQKEVEKIERNNYQLCLPLGFYYCGNTPVIAKSNRKWHYYSGSYFDAYQIMSEGELINKINEITDIEKLETIKDRLNDLKIELATKYKDFNTYFKIIYLESELQEKEKMINILRDRNNELYKENEYLRNKIEELENRIEELEPEEEYEEV